MRWLSVSAVLLAALFGAVPFVAATAEAQVAVIAAETVDDGTVRVDFSVRGVGGLPITDLTPADIRLSEAADNVTLSVEPLLPVTTLVLVDLSFGSNVEAIRATLQAYLENYYEPRDNLVLYILDGADSVPRVAEINSVEAGRLALGSIQQASSRFYDLKPTCDLMLAYIDRVGLSPSQPIHIIHVGSFLNSPDLSIAGARLFAEQGVPYHGIQAHTARPTGDFQRMVNAGSGLFVNNETGAYVLDDGSFTPVNALRLLYETVARSRNLYTLNYRPTTPPQNQPRTVEMTLRLTDGAEIATSFRYEWGFEPPVIAFTDAGQLNPQRAALQNDGDEVGFDLSVQPLNVSVTYPDGNVRPLRSLQLQVVDVQTGALLESVEIPVEAGTGGTYTIPWSLAGFDVPESTTEVELIISAADALGFVAEVRQRARVEVSSVPPTPTSAPQVAQAATTDELATLNAAVAIGTRTAFASEPVAGELRAQETAPAAAPGWLPAVLLIVVILAIVMAAVALYLMIRTNRLEQQLVEAQTRQMTQPPASVVAAPVPYNDPMYDTESGYDKPAPPPPTDSPTVYARLLVKSDIPELKQRLIEVNKSPFVIGRAIDADFRIDLPFISPKHCALRLAENHFQIRDMSSVNGTFINGERIDAGREIVVQPGSEVSVTKNIILEIWDMQTDLSQRLRTIAPTATGEASRVKPGEVAFKPLPGLEYQPDDGDPVDDRYSPL